MIVYKNAGIKSREEAKSRLEAGEVFHFNHGTPPLLLTSRIFYDSDFIWKGMCPYRCENSPLKGFWDNFEDWHVENTWFYEIRKPVPCWVGNGNNREVRNKIDMIETYNDASPFPFHSVDNDRGDYNSYQWAIPIRPEDLDSV